MKLMKPDVEYIVNDADILAEFLDSFDMSKEVFIEKVIFNDPATIILWDDGTKTVVKCKEGDPYSKEGGFALCVLKRLAGHSFHKMLRDYIPEEEETSVQMSEV